MPRTGFCLIVCALSAALYLGRGAPRVPPARDPSPPAVAGLSGWFSAEGRDGLIDLASGRVRHAPVAGPGLVTAHPVCSPWLDTRGRRELVARWHCGRSERSLSVPHSWGLARFSYPDGGLIERVECERVPAGPPAWLPGAAARVIFASGDGELYRYDFERGRGTAPPLQGEGRESAALPWLVRGDDGARHPLVRDVSCPAVLPGGPWLLATLYRPRGGRARVTAGAYRLWWLRLTHDAVAVADAGPLALDRPDDAAGWPEECSPVAAPAEGGGLTLAYLSRGGEGNPWDVRVAALGINPASGVPGFLVSGARVLARDAKMNAPAFSPDGHWVYALTGRDGDPPRVARLANPLAGPEGAAEWARGLARRAGYP